MISNEIDSLLNNKITSNIPTKQARLRNLIASVGSDVEKETIKGIIAINI